MPIKRMKLTFPEELIREPVIFTMAKQFDVMPNIRRARSENNVGEVVLELDGDERNLEQGVEFLRNKGITIEMVADIAKV